MKYNFKDFLIDFGLLISGGILSIFFFHLNDTSPTIFGRILVCLLFSFIIPSLIYFASNSKNKNEEAELQFLESAEKKLNGAIQKQVSIYGVQKTRTALRVLTITIAILTLLTACFFCGFLGLVSILTKNIFEDISFMIVIFRIIYKGLQSAQDEPPS